MPTVNCNIHNRFDIEVIDAQSGEIKQRAQAENIILNALWTKLLSASPAYNQYIHYGTGSGTPVASRTQLFTFLGSKAPATADNYPTIVPETGVFSLRRKITISETEHVGSTLSEVGIASGSGATTLVTHALLKDMNGNTVTIVKTATDIVNIYATVFVHWNPDGYDHAFIVPSQSEGFLLYLAGMAGSSGSTNAWAPSAIQFAEGCTYFNSAPGTGREVLNLSNTYDATNKKLICTATRLGVPMSNADGLKYVVLASALVGASYPTRNTYASPAIVMEVGGSFYPGTNIISEAVGTGDGSAKDFATKFSYPENAKVYVNGVQVSSGVVVEKKPIAYNDMGKYFVGLNLASTPARHIFSPVLATPSSAALTNFGFDSLGKSIYYNPNYEVGIGSMTASNCSAEVSNDLVNWVSLFANASGVQAVPSAYQHYKYFRFKAQAISSVYHISSLTAPATYLGKNIHFSTPPASGAVITADYFTETIAKDANHVFDLTVTIQLGELIV